MKKLISYIMLIVFLGVIDLGILINFDYQPAMSAGYTTTNITAAQNRLYSQEENTPWAAFGILTGTTVADIQNTGMSIGLGSDTVSPKYRSISRGLVGFNLSTLPEGVEVESASIWLYQFRSNPIDWPGMYYSFFDTALGGATPVVTDFANFRTLHQVVTEPVAIEQMNAAYSWIEYPVYSWALENVLSRDSTNQTWLNYISYNDFAYADPGWLNFQQQNILIYGSVDGALRPYLQINYATPAADRDMEFPTNDTDYTGVIIGDEDISAVDWNTPRAAFNDELIGFRVTGDPGASFGITLYSSAGVIMSSTNNTIKDDGYYHWNSQSVDADFTGWIRATAISAYGSTINTEWGRVENIPNNTQRLLTVSAVDTEYPQYDYDFDRYIIYKNGIGTVFWKTNLLVGDLGNYELKILAGGDSSYPSWNGTFTYINTEIFKTQYANNLDQAHWRFMMFSPYVDLTGFNTYDGFIQNAAKNYSLNYTGFWQGTIRDGSDNPLTWTDSAYFYLNSPDQGVIIALDDSNSDPGDNHRITITIGEHSKVGTRLTNVSVQLLDYEGTVLSTGSGFVIAGINYVDFTAPMATGDYQMRLSFSDSSLVPDYAYIVDVPFTVGDAESPDLVESPDEPGSLTDWIDTINNYLDKYHLNNSMGHWFLIILLIILIAAIFGVYGKMPLVATVICILIFIGGLYLGWIDPWVIALLSLGAGVTGWIWFRRMAEAKNSKET